jgi:hypothetical protein
MYPGLALTRTRAESERADKTIDGPIRSYKPSCHQIEFSLTPSSLWSPFFGPRKVQCLAGGSALNSNQGRHLTKCRAVCSPLAYYSIKHQASSGVQVFRTLPLVKRAQEVSLPMLDRVMPLSHFRALHHHFFAYIRSTCIAHCDRLCRSGPSCSCHALRVDRTHHTLVHPLQEGGCFKLPIRRYVVHKLIACRLEPAKFHFHIREAGA